MFKKILFFYIDGFKNLSDTGRKLWVIIIIKLVVIFVVLKVFFFPTITSKVKKEDLQDLYINQITKVTTYKQKKEE
jgi:flagellar basal body-associated protein FliL